MASIFSGSVFTFSTPSSFFNAMRVEAAQEPQVQPLTPRVTVFVTARAGHENARTMSATPIFLMRTSRSFEKQSRVIGKCSDKDDKDCHDPQGNLLAPSARWPCADGAWLTGLGWRPPVGEIERSTEEARGRDQEVWPVRFEFQQECSATQAQYG